MNAPAHDSHDTKRAARWPHRALLATDGSPHSIRAAEVLAAMVHRDSSVRLVTVAGLEYAPYDDKWGQLSDEPERQARLRAVGDTAFEKPVEHLMTSGCQIEKSVRLGNATEQIMIEIHNWKPDLVVVGRAGRRKFERLLLGSVSEHLLKHSPVPVLVVP
jgi:nucleotide-binding universal stress UspA family protein